MNLDHIKPGTATSILVQAPDYRSGQDYLAELACRLNCLGSSSEPCHNCRQIQSGNASFLTLVGPTTKTSTGIEAIRQISTQLALKPPTSTVQRVVIITQADTLTIPAANAMLKLAEEPPEATIIGLVTLNGLSLPATLRSRCQFILLGTLATDTTPSDTEKIIREIFAQTPFDRLKSAGQLSETYNASDLSRALVRDTIDAATNIPVSVQTRRLTAIDTYRRHARAGVNAKTAIENLMLEYI